MPIPKNEPCTTAECTASGDIQSDADAQDLTRQFGVTLAKGERIPAHYYSFHHPNGFGQMPCSICGCNDFTMA